MAYYNKKYKGKGSTGTSMQGRVESVLGKGNAKCIDCQYLSGESYCIRRKASAWWTTKRKYCKYYKEKGE